MTGLAGTLFASIAIPAPIRRFLPHALIVLSVVLLLGGLVLWIDHRGYQRASHDRDLADAKLRAEIKQDILDYEHRSVDRENARASDTMGKLDQIARNTAAGSARIIKEMTHEVRFTDPALGIPPSVRDEINRALAASSCTRTPDGGIRCTVQDAGTAGDH